MNKFIVYQGNNGRALLIPALERRGNWVEASEQEAEKFRAQFIWKQTVLPIRAYNKLSELVDQGFGVVVHNHLQNNRCITTKTGLIRSLRHFYQSNEHVIYTGYTAHETIPTSFIITAQTEDSEYKQLITRVNELAENNFTREHLPEKHLAQNIWLLKPAALNQGRGIEVCRGLKDLQTCLRSKPVDSLWVVQKYIEKPLLFHGRKFDIRIWALATAKHDLFYYKVGYIRTSSSEYSLDATDNYVHLTNNCLQKHGEDYGAFEEGNTISFEAFQSYLDTQHPEQQVNFWQHLLPRIKDLMIDTYLSGRKVMEKNKRSQAFELLGFDFLIDEDFRVWLLEVNTNPYLGVPNQFIADLLPLMIDDMLALVLDSYFPPKTARTRTTNDFELLYCDVASCFSPDGTSKNFRQSYTSSIYLVPGTAPPQRKRFSIDREPETVNEGPKLVVKDVLQTVKEALEGPFMLDTADFAPLCRRIMGQLNNWEFLSEEQVKTCLAALHLVVTNQGALALVNQNHCPALVSLIGADNVPEFIQSRVLNTLSAAAVSCRIRKSLVSLGLTELLVNCVLASHVSSSVQAAAVQTLMVFTNLPSKNVYIPGETREFKKLRTELMTQGAIVALYVVKDTLPDETLKESLSTYLMNEFTLQDWEAQLAVLESEITSPQSKGFPLILREHLKLEAIRQELTHLCETLRNDLMAQAETERRRREEEIEAKSRKEAEERKAQEDKRNKAREYIEKRYEEIRTQKMRDDRRREEDRAQAEKYSELKRLQILEKASRVEEQRRTQRLKEKQRELELKKLKDEQQKISEESRKKALENWHRKKNERERERRAQEIQKKEEDERRRAVEAEARREMLAKLEEKKQRRAAEARRRPDCHRSVNPRDVFDHPMTAKDFKEVTHPTSAPKDYSHSKDCKYSPPRTVKSHLDKYLMSVYKSADPSSHVRSKSKNEFTMQQRAVHSRPL